MASAGSAADSPPPAVPGGPPPNAPAVSAGAPSSSYWFDVFWLPLLLAWSAGWCLTASPKIGVTYDEPFYLDAGMEAWRGWVREDGKPRGWAHEAAVTNGVMPLPPDL